MRIFDRELINGCGLKSLFVVVVVVVAVIYPPFLIFFKSVPFRHISIYGEIISHFWDLKSRIELLHVHGEFNGIFISR